MTARATEIEAHASGRARDTRTAKMPEENPPSVRPEVTRWALFAGFFQVGISGFGGVLPWARRMMVEQRAWLTEREFIETLSLCQVLPGPNIVNVSVYVGRRFQGATGALAAFAGLMVAPCAIVLLLATFYGRYLHVAAVHGAIRGVSAAAAGLVVATGIKMARPYRGSVRAVAFATATFAAVALGRYPLGWVVLVLGPLSVLAGQWRAR